MDAGDFFAAMGYGVVESGPDDAFAGLAGDELDGVDRIFFILYSTPMYKSSVFSRKVTISTLGKGVLTAVFDLAGRILA